MSTEFYPSFCFCNVLHLMTHVCWPTLASLERSQCLVAHNPFIVMLNVNLYFVEDFMSMFIGVTGLGFLFVVVVVVFLSDFSNRVLWPWKMI